MKLIRSGCTRTVILTKQWAIKLPCLDDDWRHFLLGLLANMRESGFWINYRGKPQAEKLCPVVLSVPGGFLNVMPRVVVLDDDEDCDGYYADLCSLVDVEPKTDSFGWLDGRVVAVDYGGFER